MNKSISDQYGNRCLRVNRDNIVYSMVLDFNKGRNVNPLYLFHVIW